MTTRIAAALWCAAYGGLGLWWAAGGDGFPFGAGDPNGADMMSWLAGARPGPTGTVIAIGGAVGVVCSLWRSRAAAAVLLVLAVPLLFVVPDVRLLQNLAYALRGFVGLVDWPVLNQALCAGGGFLLAAAALPRLRRPGRRWNWARIGRWATAVAVVGPLPYALQRAAWNLGIPLGVDEAFVEALAADLRTKGYHPLTAYSLVVPAILGSLLTLGLSMRWGEVVPRWVPLLGGRRVPVPLAVVPATVVSLAVTVAGLTLYRMTIAGGGGVDGTALPGLLWLPWGLALALATLAYQRRRAQSRCSSASSAT